jgi:hypothetical protein
MKSGIGVPKNPRAPMECQRCGDALPLVRHYKTYLCGPCKDSLPGPSKKAGYEAQAMVRAAVRFGYLMPSSRCTCTDCGAPAKCYDHRDYNKPLEVDPVCVGCNIRRGAAKPRVPVEQPAAA